MSTAGATSGTRRMGRPIAALVAVFVGLGGLGAAAGAALGAVGGPATPHVAGPHHHGDVGPGPRPAR
jgi:hypothetical protein